MSVQSTVAMGQQPKRNEDVPKTFFQLLVKLARSFVKSLVWRLVFGAIAFVAVFIIHTYLMVVVNDTLRVVADNKILAMILNLIPSKPSTPTGTWIQKMNIYLFWVLISTSLFGSLARIVAFGIKSFFVDIGYMFKVLFVALKRRENTSAFIKIILGTILGLLAGTFLFNNAVCVVVAVFVFLSTSQKEKSIFILALTLIKSDFQRFFKVKKPTIFNIDGFITISVGVSFGLLISAIIPGQLFGSSIVSIVLKLILAIAIVVLATMNLRKKGNLNVFLVFIPIAVFFIFKELNVFADDTGWTESGKTLKGWLNNSGTPQGLKLGLSPAVLSSLANLLGPMFPGFIKDMIKDPNKNPYQYIRDHLSKDQHDKLKQKVSDYNQLGIDAAVAEAEAYNSTLGFWGNVFEGSGKDMAEIGNAVAEFTETLVVEVPAFVWNNTSEALGNSSEFVSQVGTAVKGFAGDAVDVVKDLFANNGEILIDTLKLSGQQIVDDPIGSGKLVAEKIYEMAGIKDIVESTDSSKSATERAGLYTMGIVKLWGLIDGAGAVADATTVGGAQAISKLKGLADDLAKAIGGGSDDVARVLGNSTDDIAQLMERAGVNKLSPEEVQRLLIFKENQAAGKAVTDKLVKAMESGRTEDDFIKQILEVQQDKNAMKALNELAETNPNVINKFNDNLNKLYKSVDDDTLEQLIASRSKKLPPGSEPLNPKDFEVLKIKNTSDKVKAGFDRDVTIRYKGKDVPSKEWEELYKKNLFEKTKGKLPDGVNEKNIMEKLDQTCTDKFNPESYGSSETAVNDIVKGTVHDIANPQQVGDAISYKGLKHFNEAEKIRQANPFGLGRANAEAVENEIREGMRQLTKQWDNQIEAATKAYGLPKDSRLEQAIKIMKRADVDSPVVIEKALKLLDYTKEGVAKDLGVHFENLVLKGRHLRGH